MFGKFLSYLRQEGQTLGRHCLRFTSAGGAPLDMGLKQACEALFGQPLHNGYGMTEAAPSMAMTRVDFPRADGSVGQPLPHVELVAMGPDEKPVADGETGDIWCRGPGVMKGYYKAPELTREVITPEGWLKTGDIGFFDSEGSLHISGRSKELIIRSGFNVFPPEVESVLSKHPGVVLSAVVGRAAEDGNEDVVAYVQVNPATPPAIAELAALCAGHLAPYKRPSVFILCRSLPATPMGKVLKHRLAAEAVPLASIAP
jgi:acyl-CoA synthetase (AMP-forming)/AMP-acid ligase II